MKKLSLASIILTIIISLVGCTNSGAASNGNTDPSTQNRNESNIQDSSENSMENNNVNNNSNNTGNISKDKAEEIAISHAGLSKNQVDFKRKELELDNGIQKYEVEFYYNNKEYSYEIDANTGDILSYEQD